MKFQISCRLMLSAAFLTSPLIARVAGQCDPSLTARVGGDVPHVTSIDSNRILVARSRGLEIYNVANAAAPVFTGRLDIAETIHKMKVISGRAYVVTDSGSAQNIRVYTVSGPTPIAQSTLSTADNLDFDSIGTTMFVASHTNLGQTTITALDVSLWEFPLFLSQLTLPAPSTWYSSTFISVSGSRAFVSYSLDSAARLAAINIADPESMSLLGLHDESASPYFRTVAVSGNYAYVCHADKVDILSLTSFPNFPQVATIPNIGAYDATILGSTLYVASSYSGVRPYNLATPTAPVAYSPANTSGTSSDIEILGDRLYNADREGGVTILQVGNPASITMLGTIAAPTPSRVRDIVNVGSTLYVLDELGLRIFSTASPDAPVLLGSLTLPDAATNGCSSRTLGVYNSNAYITGCDDHLIVVGVANPAAPFIRANLSGFDADYQTAFSGNYAYFCGQPGLWIVNISNPSAPLIIGTYTFGGVTSSVATQGGYLYLGTRDNGLWILSLANPAAPQLVGFSATPLLGACYGLAVSGNTAFVGRGSALEITDIANPANPIVLSSLPDVNAGVHTPVNYSNGILHVDAYLGSDYSSQGIHRIDVSSLTQPVLISSLRGDFSAFSVIGSRLYAGDFSRDDMIISALQTQWKPAFRRQPQDTKPCLGAYALLNVNVSAQPIAVTYRWHKDAVPLPIDGRFVGANQANLTILNLVRSDAGQYTCVATNSCGTTTSLPAALTFCIADFNCDTVADFSDYLDFVNAFSTNSPAADFNFDTLVDFNDYLDFVDALSMGC